MDEYFSGTATKIEGIGIEEIIRETIERHEKAYGNNFVLNNMLAVGGEYAFRLRGEDHVWNPETVSDLQHAVRGNLPEKYISFAKKINEQSQQIMNPRGLFEFVEQKNKILKPDLFLIMFTASSRREHFDINGEMIDLFPNWRNGNPPFKKWNVYEGLEELINPNSDALNIYMNYKFIEMILEKHNIPWLFSSSGLGLPYAESDFMLNVIDNDKFIGDWIYSDMADDDKHPGEKSHQEISNLFFDKFKEEILGKHPSFL